MKTQLGRPKKGTSRLDEPIPYEISAVWLDGLLRICATCGVDHLPSGYRYGEEYFCEEHRPEHFARDFRILEAKQKESGDLFQEWDCYWTKWETVDNDA
jgi:hypothetical protein